MSCGGAGLSELDPWWSRLGWDDDASNRADDTYRRVLDEEYRRVQQVYAEIVETSFSQMARDMLWYPILPLRWKLTVTRRGARQTGPVVHFHWIPVESWNEAGADVNFADQGPQLLPHWMEAQEALVRLGRPTHHMPGSGGWSLHFSYDGTGPNGHFSGSTPVTTEAMSWLLDDINALFRQLPSSDGAF